MSYFSNIKQNVVANSNNSSTTNLAAGNSYTFTGTGASTLGVVGIQVSLKTDKNCTVKIQQSPDNTNWDIEDIFIYYYSKGGQSWTVQAVNSYTRVIVTTSSETTTYFRLQMALCPMVEALPRSSSADGKLKTSTRIHGDDFIKDVLISPMRSIKTAQALRLIGKSFDGATLDNNFWVSSVGTNGTVTLASGEASIATGETANNTTSIVSFRTARYIGASHNYYRGQIRLPAWTTGAGHTTTAKWGAWDLVNDGYYFEAVQTNPAATPTLQLRSIKATVPATAITSFNGDYGASYTLDNNIHTYEIHWTNKDVWFFIDDILLHKVSASTATLVSTPSLKIGILIVNSGGNTNNNSIVSRSSTINRLGAEKTEPIYKNISGNAATWVLKYGAGVLHRIIFNNTSGTSFIIYDNSAASGNKLASITTASGAIGAWEYMCPFYTGLTIITTGNGLDLTVVYE